VSDLGTAGSVEKGLRLNLHIDGASRGNPGMAGAGVWMTDQQGNTLQRIGRFLGRKTNNEAEYWALLIGLREAQRWGKASIHIFTDSELVAKQVKGVYRVRDSNLKGLHRQVMENLKTFLSFEIESIPREENREADRLANEAIRRKIAKDGGRESAQ